MKKYLLASLVAGMFATSAQAGITIPAGEWTVDINGNVNAFYTNTTATGKGATAPSNTIGTGLLPAQLGIGGKSRQNDLDIAWQFSFFTGTSSGTNTANGSNTINIRQAYLSFGDASWGSIKLGRDLGVFGSDVISNDMTLLGVGPINGGVGGNATYGRIGSGYVYADWLGQIQYSTPNFNGLQATVALVEPLNGQNSGQQDSQLGYQGKVTYDLTVAGVKTHSWLGGVKQDRKGTAGQDYSSEGYEVGTKLSAYDVDVVGYYYNGEGLSGVNPQSANLNGLGGIGFLMNGGVKTDDEGGLVQVTYKLPVVNTKVGASWGESKASYNGADFTNKAWTVGAYHPLTKSLNLVAEYSRTHQTETGASTAANNGSEYVNTTSIGAILFF